MAVSQPKCPFKDIPRRLHLRGRPKQTVSLGDKLYIRHRPLAQGQTYLSGGIPENRCLDQSGNSHELNTPRGDPRDVLYDTRRGNHYFTHQIACVGVAEVQALKVPNAHTIVYAEDGTIKSQDIFIFEVEHEPTPCMYPHCVIHARKNKGQALKRVAAGVTTAIKVEFGRIAESHRSEMIKFQHPRLGLRDLFKRLWLALRG